MNATSLYVSTSRLVFQSDGINDQNWTDLYRLVPYLRQSLSCTVCSCLLIEPFTPINIHCQHHVCRLCLGGRKNLKPACGWCKDYEKYEENVQLRILLQCYKSLCEHILTTPMYNIIQKQNQTTGLEVDGISIPNLSLVEFLEEGANFIDVFKSKSGLSRSAYSILPCVFPNANQIVNKSQTQKQTHSNLIPAVTTPEITCTKQLPIKTVSNGTAMYSVLHTGIGNKITIKRKTDKEEEYNNKNTIRSRSIPKRRGCRCGNATSTPGKLTCCGQRCPCYVESKPCVDCKCRGCRNPHRPDGAKIRPHIPELACYEIQMAGEAARLESHTLSSSSNTLDIFDGEIGLSRFQKTVAAPFPSQFCQPMPLENIAHESLLISSQEGKFQVLNLFASSTAESKFQPNNLTQNSPLDTTLHNKGYQIATTSAKMPQILVQSCHSSGTSSDDILTSKVGTNVSYSANHSTLNLSSSPNLNSNNFGISPLLVNSLTAQLMNGEKMSTQRSTQNSLQSQPLIDLVSAEGNSSDNLNV